MLASVAAAVGLIAADRAVTWGIESVNRATGGAPFWMTPGLKLSTILYAGGLAVVSAAMLSLLPALKVTRARVQPHLANLGSGGATLRFGRVWTGAMIVQVALTAIGIPVALESVSRRCARCKSAHSFQAGSISPLASMWTGRSTRRPRRRLRTRRARTFAELAAAHRAGARRGRGHLRRPRAGVRAENTIRRSRVLPRRRAGATTIGFRTSAVGPGFFEAFDRPIVAGRAFHGGDCSPAPERSSSTRRSRARFRARREAGRRSALACGFRCHPARTMAPAGRR